MNWKPMTMALLAGAMMIGVAPAQIDSSAPYVPTPHDVVEKMLRMARVDAGDYVIDLGSGDGRILVTAAKQFGARGFGVDIDSKLIAVSEGNARKAGVSERVAFYNRDLFKTDISDATVLTMYLLPQMILTLRPRLLDELKPGTRVVSHDFGMAQWEPDQSVSMYSPEKYFAGDTSHIFLWIVPAKAAGKWRWRLAFGGTTRQYELDATQDYQKLQGSMTVDGRSARISDGRLRGANLSFKLAAEVGGTLVMHEFSGRVVGDTIAGEVALSGARMQSRLAWDAARSGAHAESTQSPALARIQ